MLISLKEAAKILGVSSDTASMRLKRFGLNPIVEKSWIGVPIRRHFYDEWVIRENIDLILSRKKRKCENFTNNEKINVKSPYYTKGITDLEELKRLKNEKIEVSFIDRRNNINHGVIKEFNSMVVVFLTDGGKEIAMLRLEAGIRIEDDSHNS